MPCAVKRGAKTEEEEGKEKERGALSIWTSKYDRKAIIWNLSNVEMLHDISCVLLYIHPHVF